MRLIGYTSVYSEMVREDYYLLRNGRLMEECSFEHFGEAILPATLITLESPLGAQRLEVHWKERVPDGKMHITLPKARFPGTSYNVTARGGEHPEWIIVYNGSEMAAPVKRLPGKAVPAEKLLHYEMIIHDIHVQIDTQSNHYLFMCNGVKIGSVRPIPDPEAYPSMSGGKADRIAHFIDVIDRRILHALLNFPLLPHYG